MGGYEDLRAETYQKLSSLDTVENEVYENDEGGIYQAVIQILQQRLNNDMATYQPYVLQTTGNLEAQSWKQMTLATNIIRQAMDTYYDQQEAA